MGRQSVDCGCITKLPGLCTHSDARRRWAVEGTGAGKLLKRASGRRHAIAANSRVCKTRHHSMRHVIGRRTLARHYVIDDASALPGSPRLLTTVRTPISASTSVVVQPSPPALRHLQALPPPPTSSRLLSLPSSVRAVPRRRLHHQRAEPSQHHPHLNSVVHLGSNRFVRHPHRRRSSLPLRLGLVLAGPGTIVRLLSLRCSWRWVEVSSTTAVRSHWCSGSLCLYLFLLRLPSAGR